MMKDNSIIANLDNILLASKEVDISEKEKNKYATKALFGQLEGLLDSLDEKVTSLPKSSKSSSSKSLDIVSLIKNNPSKAAKLLEKLTAKGGDTKELADILQSLSISSKNGQVSISDVAALINALKKPADVETRFKSLITGANFYMDKAEKAMDEQGISKQEAMNHPEVKKGLGAIFGNAALNSNEDDLDSMTYVKMKFALDLSQLMNSVYTNQNDQSNQMTELLKGMQESSKTLCDNQIKAFQDEQVKEQQANNKPWYEYVIGAAVLIAGAALTLCTAGTAAPVVAALCVSVIVGVTMMSPAGSAITNALDTAMAGNNPTIGTQIASSCIIAAITTILTLGAGGFTTAAEGAETAVADVAEDAVKGAVKGALRYSVGAATAGLGTRAAGTLIQNIIGSGILIQAVQGIMELTPDGKKALEDTGVEIALAVAGAVASVGIAYGAGSLIGAGGEERESFLKENDLQDGGIKGSEGLRKIAIAAEFTALMAQGGVNIAKYFLKSDLQSAQLKVGEIQAQYSTQNFNQQQAQALQSSISTQAQSQAKSFMDIQGGVLDSIGEENENIVSAIVG